MGKRKKKPSKTRRHRESVAAKRKAKAFYRMRTFGTDVSTTNKTASSVRRRRVALLAAMAAVVSMFAAGLGMLLWAVAKMFP